MNIDDLFSLDFLSFDVESTGLHLRYDAPIGFNIAGSADKAFYIPIEDGKYRRLLADEDKTYIGHNLKFDRAMVKKAGIAVDRLCDTMVAGHLLEETNLSLPSLILGKTGRTIREFKDLKVPILTMSYDDMASYFGSHARAAWILWFGYEDKNYEWLGYSTELRRNMVWDTFWDLEMPLVPVISDMELNGVAVDRQYLSELGSYFDGRIELLEEALAYWSDKFGIKVNFNSPDQVADLFYAKLRIKPSWRRTSSGRPTVEAEYLTEIKSTHPIIPLYLAYKHYQKLKGTYVNAILRDMVDGRLYGSFNQTGTRTSRLSSTDPNLQNIPIRTEEGRKIRQAFIAPEGYSLVKADADQLELKVGAHWSKDVYLLDAFRQKRDIHVETAIRAFGDATERPRAKTLNYQIQYGGGSQKDQDAFYSAYPGMLRWARRTKAEAVELGYVRTLFNRKRTIPELRSSNDKVREHGEREAVSTIIQGSSAEVVKVGMRRVWEDTKDNSDVKGVLQVHDEDIYQVSDKIVGDFAHYLGPRLQYDELEVPITYTISVGKNWSQMVEVPKS